MHVARLLVTAAAVAVAGLAFATPAVADGVPVPIQGSQLPTTAEGFSSKGCTGPLAGLLVGHDGWHFVTAGQAPFSSVTLKFHTVSGDVTLTITGSEASPTTGTGWKGWLDNAGSADKHAYLITDAGWELVEGSAIAEGFSLSQTCVAKVKSDTAASSPAVPSGAGGNLPKTGTATGAFLIAGIALIAGGVLLLAVRRRRDVVGY